MPFNNPFKKDGENNPPNPEANGGNGEPKKTDAELLAETINGALTAALKPVTEAVGAVNARVEAFEKRFEKKPPENNEPEEFASVFENEDLAIGQRVVKAVGPLYQRQLAFEAKSNFNEVKQEYVAAGHGEILAQFGQKIEELLNATPLIDGQGQPHRGNKQYIRNTINMVLGEAAMSQGMRFGGKDRGFFIESAGGSSEAAGGYGRQDDGLTEGQRRVFSRMKVPVEDAKKTVSKLKFIN